MAVSQGLIGESVMNRNLNTDVFPVKDKLSMASALDRLLERRVTEVNAQDVAGWDALGSLDDWEACKRPRIEALERSLGKFPEQERPLIAPLRERSMRMAMRSISWCSSRVRESLLRQTFSGLQAILLTSAFCWCTAITTHGRSSNFRIWERCGPGSDVRFW